MDADLGQVGIEHVAQRVVRHFAHKGSAAAQRGNAGGGIGGRAAGNLLPAQRHLGVQVLGPIGVDQVHDALGHALALDEAGFHRGDDVNDRIADGQHVEAGLGHGGTVRVFAKGP
ncbi:hypothetical protein D3C87_1891610 [compost metagenome]